MELSLREALQLGHNYIGTEHMLLGLVREGEGVAAQVLALLAKGQNNDISPLHCEHDQLTICADPEVFTEDEIAKLEELGFHAGKEESFYSFRFGSA